MGDICYMQPGAFSSLFVVSSLLLDFAAPHTQPVDGLAEELPAKPEPIVVGRREYIQSSLRGPHLWRARKLRSHMIDTDSEQNTNTNSSSLQGGNLLKQVVDRHDYRLSPNFNSGKTTVVEMNILITSFDSISETEMDLQLSMMLRQRWTDHRLAFTNLSDVPFITIDSEAARDAVWVPDVFFVNEKESRLHLVPQPNRYIRIYSNGTVLYSIRLTTVLACSMNLQKFPLDTQLCYCRIESYAHTNDMIELSWMKYPYNGVELVQGGSLPQFDILNYTEHARNVTYSTGNFTQLFIQFELGRDIRFYLLQTYFPSILIVVLSWISFWISADAIPARITLGVLTILTMTTQSTGAVANLPRVSYVKAIDVWMSANLFFVFAALIEFAFVNVWSRKDVRIQMRCRDDPAAMAKDNQAYDREMEFRPIQHALFSVQESLNRRRKARTESDNDPVRSVHFSRPMETSNEDLGGVGEASTPSKEKPSFGARWKALGQAALRQAVLEERKSRAMARNIDRKARRLFPITYAIFIVIYWVVYAVWEPVNSRTPTANV